MTNKYKMRISRLTIDKLGVKLYDKVSAVIAELVSNSYDADATEVTIEAPMDQYLASKAGGKIADRNFEIKVTDNGIGMTPSEVNDYYLVVGAERRVDNRPRRGDISPRFNRKVMGRKGVGKLAPFGICEVMEVFTSGGEKITRPTANGKTETGYQTAHLILNRQDMLEDTEFEYEPETSSEDDTLQPSSGTTITLKHFAYRRVSAHSTFSRQLSQRFGLPTENWIIKTRDTTKMSTAEAYESILGPFSVETMANSKITLYGPPGPNLSVDDNTEYRALGPTGEKITEFGAGFHHDGRFYPITGWAAYAQNPYRDDLMAGVRIYCRGKIAGQTAVFNRGAGFHGEHSIRSYLVGELHADWLDEYEDLIQTDRRDILWSHDLGQEFQDWGQQIIKKIGYLARDPMRKKTWDRFAEVGNVEERIVEAFPADGQKAIRDRARELVRLLGQTIRADEVEDIDVVEPMVQLSLTLAPHITLDDKLREAADAENTPMAVISGILRTARLAELSSFGRIAEDRLKVIERVQGLKDDAKTAEQKLQELIHYAPWLINPQWAPIVANQAFTTLRNEFEKFYTQKTGQKISLADFSETRRRPDFVLSSQDNGLQIIEIKKPMHKLTNDEMDRIVLYHDAMDDFLNDPGNKEFRQIFLSFHITLVCDELSLSGAQKVSFESYRENGKLMHINWKSFLLRTKKMHEDFLAEAEKQKKNLVKPTG